METTYYTMKHEKEYAENKQLRDKKIIKRIYEQTRRGDIMYSVKNK